ncbi:nucleotidyl transferase AbiEii/AbiGii toxin family protein [Helicobacter sp. MIT 14-3879]|uniref:nucleotidyl transferase AbiEii/AbiGii toxin family protein n=1 Tax=Helicobacter sp. MIT 14-3879 TaxID=2040649 RepID=UPI000E1E512D|nr:nucleotidyl transferase AbiEii/AbiGii toxin family protein [Helicobacter sp. MIT 14-3879]RDU61494.1 nucleotidyl transferase AbiEii/AbiGii toxin family protein [Helicobacter sp. MIT 14-3879]
MDIEKLIQKYPQNLKDTIFKEIMHYEILESLFNIQDIQNTLVFQGGTALRLCYNNDRYSEDLDFVIHKDREFNKDFMCYFRDVFSEKIIKKYNLQAEITEPKKDDSIVQRWSAKVYLPSNNKKTKINIEIANIPSHSNHFKAIKNNYEELINKRIFVQVETLEEILADKILALSQRPYLKFRDLWDIEWLKNNKIQINYDLLSLKIKDYKCDNFLESLEKRKIELNNPNLEKNFLNEMSRFLDEKYFMQVKNIHFFTNIQNSTINEIDEILINFKNLQEKLEVQSIRKRR